MLSLNGILPLFATARIFVPASNPGQVFESSAPAAKQPGIALKCLDSANAIFEAGSGHYHFTTNRPG